MSGHSQGSLQGKNRPEPVRCPRCGHAGSVRTPDLTNPAFGACGRCGGSFILSAVDRLRAIHEQVERNRERAALEPPVPGQTHQYVEPQGALFPKFAVWLIIAIVVVFAGVIFYLAMGHGGSNSAVAASQPGPTPQKVTVPEPAVEPPSRPAVEVAPGPVVEPATPVSPPAAPLSEPEAPVARQVEPEPDRAPVQVAQLAADTAPRRNAPARRRPAIRPVPVPVPPVTDEQIGKAIQRGADYLLSRVNGNQYTPSDQQTQNFGSGIDALVVYALLQAGQAIDDPRLRIQNPLMRNYVGKLAASSMETYYATYARGLRATALGVYNRPEDRAALRADLEFLLNSHNGKAGYYYGKSTPESPWDNSNTQYGVLGVWSVAETGLEVPQKYWRLVEEHFTNTQLPDGQWDYTKNRTEGRLSMTLAGIASLYVANDYLDGPRYGTAVGREPFSRPLARAMAWLETGDNSVVGNNEEYWGYTLFSLERVGLASGFKYFGTHDWYRELAATVVARQEKDGSWKNDVDTAYALLFLSRGRHPILMNKLRFDGHWANRPRDAANLARYTSRALERPLNWQVVSFKQPWWDWLDCPILYIASDIPPLFNDTQWYKIQRYVQAGGMLFTQADGDSKAFDEFVTNELRERLFPEYQWQEVPAEHPLYSAVYKIEPMASLKMLTNGSRVLVLHSSTDLSQAWQLRADKTQGSAHQLGVNLFIYAAGKQDHRNRLTSAYFPEIIQAPLQTVPLARLRYEGNWNPEPGSYERFGRAFFYDTSLRVGVVPVEIQSLTIDIAPVAHLTGTEAVQLTAEQRKALADYVSAGGTLIVDACGGSRAFAESIRPQLQEMFIGRQFERVDGSHRLFQMTHPGMEDLSNLRARHDRNANPYPEVLKPGDDAGQIVFFPLDVSTSLLHTPTHGIPSIDPNQATQVMKNLVLHAWYGQ